MVGEYTGRAPDSVSEDQKRPPRGCDVLSKILKINRLLVRAEGPWILRGQGGIANGIARLQKLRG